MNWWLMVSFLLTNSYGRRQQVWCFEKEGITTGLPQKVQNRNINDKHAVRATYVQDPFSRMFRIEVVKKEILRKLGMSKRPPHMENLRANIPKPVFDGDISSLFSNSVEPVKTTQIVIPAEEADSKNCLGADGCFNFHLMKKIFKEQVVEFATLKFFKDTKGTSAQRINLAVAGSKVKAIASKRLPIARGWFSFGVEEEIENWKNGGKRSKEYCSFKIFCASCNKLNRFRISTRPRYRPFLLVKTTERKHTGSRKRRSLSVDCIPGYNKCCRQSLYVTFKEIGWHDWIIEPSGIEVNVCKGLCSGGQIDVAKSHGFVKKELMKNKKDNFLSICCVPIKFQKFTLLHFDEDGFIFKTTLDNMIVKECGCM